MIGKGRLMFGALALFGVTAAVAAERTPAPEGASLYFVTPNHGEAVTSPVTVRFGLSGMGVAPAGVIREDTGHHHLLINVDDIDVGQPIPADDRHVHFGGGQSEATVALPPGEHRLQLLLGDHAHIPHDPPVMSETITVRVR